MAHRVGNEAKAPYWLERKKYAVDEFEETWQRIGSA